MKIFKRKKNRKVVVVGIDGAPCSLLRDYMERGIMPGLKEMCAGGSLLKMNSTLPEISSVAWTSFLTGKNPGEHGIFGFMEIDPETYEYRFPDSRSVKAPGIWEKNGSRSVVFNIPQTYPARPINGVMVSGFVALDLKEAVYPERLFRELSAMGYRLDVNAQLAASNPEAFFRDLFETFEKRSKAIMRVYEKEDWDLFICAITETDRLHHFFFDSALEGRYYGRFADLYSRLDSFLKEMADRAEKDGAVFMTCSDHGFTEIESEVYINRWLMENGYLSLSGGEGLKGIERQSLAFCLDPSRVYIHMEGKYKKGTVGKSGREELIGVLKGNLRDIRFQGKEVIKEIFLGEEIFRGPYACCGPDLYLLPNYGFDLKGLTRSPRLFGTTRFRGMHTYDDAHFFISRDFERENLKIEDLAGIISGFLECPCAGGLK